MDGFVPSIHANGVSRGFALLAAMLGTAWVAGTSPAMTCLGFALKECGLEARGPKGGSWTAGFQPGKRRKP